MKDVAQLVFNRLLTDSTLPPIYWENVDKALPTDSHLIITFMDTGAGQEFLGTSKQDVYILQVNIAVKRGVGQLKAMDIGAKVLQLFAKNTILQASPLVSVDVTPTYGTGYYDEKWYLLPLKVSINSIS
jgi:hypothetical protein